MLKDQNEKCSEQWAQLKQARAIYKAAIFDWCHLDNDIKRNDLLPELNGTLHQQLMVSDFLQSTEMWDREAIIAIFHELVDEALNGQEEVAAWSIQALCKLKNHPVRSQIAEDIWKISEISNKSDWFVFHNAYLLLYYLGCKKDLFQYIDRFHSEIGEGEIDERDWKDFENMPDDNENYKCDE